MPQEKNIFQRVPFTAYLAPEGFENDLATELGEGVEARGRLLIVPGPPRPAAWAQNIWLEPAFIPISSIKDGAQRLRDIQRNWALWPLLDHTGRAQLIQDQLPSVSAKPLVFPNPAPTAPLGSWTLWDANTLLASAKCSSPFRHGEVLFVEDKQAPPNRAYLKLWEALTRLGVYPKPGERCLDLGASPGGWTWVLQRFGASVISVDKAPLDPRIAALPQVEVRQESAFGLKPQDIGPVDWLCSDIICYPQRLLNLVKTWKDSGLVKHFVCTLKFQGPTDHETARAFAAVPGSQLVHLYHNKHELTWMV